MTAEPVSYWFDQYRRGRYWVVKVITYFHVKPTITTTHLYTTLHQ